MMNFLQFSNFKKRFAQHDYWKPAEKVGIKFGNFRALKTKGQKGFQWHRPVEVRAGVK